MSKKLLKSLLLTFIFIIFLFEGCAPKGTQNTAQANQSITLTDTLGRQVSINGTAKKIVAIGPGALRLYCYVGTADKVVGIEQMDKDSTSGKPYMMANSSLTSLPAIGPGGPNTSPDAEKILTVKPDVIFNTFATDKAAADNLQTKTGIPVISLSYGQESTFDPDVYNSLKLIGKAIGNDKRADEVVSYMEKCKNDLDTRTKDISKEQMPSTYVGALGMKGSHGIESTQGSYSLFKAIHAKNVVDETGKTGSLMIDKEKLLQWNPDKIFIDGGGLQMVQDDLKKNPQYYSALSAFKNGEIYSQLPYNFYTTNIDTAMADVYYMGKVLYPEKFKDIDAEKKADEIYNFLLAKTLYEQMAKDYGGFKKLVLP